MHRTITPLMSTKELYKIFTLKNSCDKPNGFLMWEKIFDEHLNSKLKNTFVFIFQYLTENRLKIFRWKLIHYILPSNELLKKWKITEDNLCKHCKKKEDYEHFFVNCSYNNDFLKIIIKINEIPWY